MKPTIAMKDRFRGYLPVVIDVETGGLNPKTDALLEIAAIFVLRDDTGKLVHAHTWSEHIEPFKHANLDPEALKFNKIDPFHPFRFAISEKQALDKLFELTRHYLAKTQCQRAVLVGHNAWFDLLFLKQAIHRCRYEENPFHSFTTFDTATLGGFCYGQTVLLKAVKAAKIDFDKELAHSAKYDAEKTAELFCQMVNEYDALQRKHAAN